ncbi:putative metallopeptidase [Rhizobium sp. L80/93]|uniref:putative metallopeptidase n=1 Tax=Rhizobium sp. E27B/91 TaxID=2819995 RepID=UPI0032AF44D2
MRITIIWPTSSRTHAKGKRVIGQCEEGKPQGVMGKWSRARAEQVMEWFGQIPDFIITLAASYCAQCGDAKLMALVEHELYPAA